MVVYYKRTSSTAFELEAAARPIGAGGAAGSVGTLRRIARYPLF